jgi:hypothetical protein
MTAKKERSRFLTPLANCASGFPSRSGAGGMTILAAKRIPHPPKYGGFGIARLKVAAT